MNPALVTALQAALGEAITHIERTRGGDINDTYAITLQGGVRHFVKTHAAAPRGMYAAEAHGLQWLDAANALPVPRVIAVSEPSAALQFLVLEWIERRPPAGTLGRDHDERLGRGLAQLHRAPVAGVGLDRDNFIATLPQRNRVPSTSTWPTFYAEQRLLPLLRRATDAGLASTGLRRAVNAVIERIDVLCGPGESPSRLHGDLWAGNAITNEHGLPCLVDPAVYAGAREVDLAMMQLFGGFGPRVFEAYAEAFALSAGHEERVALYQLYPLLVHVNLFGGHYIAQAEQAARAALR